MAVILITEPDAIMLSGNPIAYVLESDLTGTNIRFIIELEAESSYGAGDFSTIGTFNKVADDAKQAIFELDCVLQSLLSFADPDPAATVLADGATQCIRYRINYADLDESTAPSFTLSSDKYVSRGQWNSYQFPSRTTTLPTTNQTMTTRPAENRAFLVGQYEWLWLLPSAGGASIDLNITVTFDDGSTGSIGPVNYGTTEIYRPIGVPLHDSIHAYSALNPNQEITEIEFSVLGETLTVAPDFDCFAFQREFLYRNSLGGFDSLITYGQGSQTDEVSKSTAEVFKPYNYTPNFRQFESFNTQTQRSQTIASGYRSKAERDAAKDIVRSNYIYIRSGNQYLPVFINNISVTDEQDGDYRYKLDFEFTYAQYEEGIAL